MRERGFDLCQGSGKVVLDEVCRDADEPDACRLEGPLALSVCRCLSFVDATINLDSERLIMAVEIKYIRPDSMLAPELAFAEPTIS